MMSPISVPVPGGAGFRSIILRILVALFIAMPLAACGEDTLVLHTAKGDFTFKIEMADTPEQQQKGLMFRQELAADAGMLFDFHALSPRAFWMRNTFIPLDMIFIDDQGIVKTVHVNAKPQDPTPIPSNVPVQFVLEIPGGRSIEIGLAPGDRMESPRIGAKSK